MSYIYIYSYIYWYVSNRIIYKIIEFSVGLVLLASKVIKKLLFACEIKIEDFRKLLFTAGLTVNIVVNT